MGASVAPRPLSPSPSGRHPLRWAAAAAALVTIAAIGAGTLPSKRGDGAGAAPTSIAVLPFRNLSEDSSHAFFAEGLHDELQTQLAKVASLRVVGRTSVHDYEGTPTPLSEIGVATSMSQFSRQMGATVGVAIFGTFLTHALTAELPKHVPLLPGTSAPSMDLAHAQSQAMNVEVIRARVTKALDERYEPWPGGATVVALDD